MKPVVRFLMLLGVISLATACARKDESATAPVGSSTSSPVADSRQNSGTARSDGQGGSAVSPSGLVERKGDKHLVEVLTTERSLAEAKGCFACHRVDTKVLGPAFAWVAYRYQRDPKAVATLKYAIEHGVSGAWGSMPMPAQSVTPVEAEELVSWVLAQKPVAPPKSD
ncbi:c-type cytochrome [Acidithiobacillus sp.]|jgi:cytochrome c|uniref:c-type cytochrome n=1 Tax=Acidithiobacillus sp. TaxID=1872118 RepID=UPI0029F7D8F0|nr:cytochrome C [Acidithiobacillus sp.]